MLVKQFSVIDNIPELDAIFNQWQDLIGNEYMGYRNHVYRMLNFCFLLGDLSEEEKRKLTIAAAFHDLGIWIDDTVDYIPPSILPMKTYLDQIGKAEWAYELTLVISEHHKMRGYQGEYSSLVELFRQADLVDFSFGLFRFGLSYQQVKTVRSHFSNSEFHKNLAKRAGRWFVKHPLNPLPMMKW